MGIDRKKVLDVALAENGYLEKRSNADLNSKTENAGSNNYTKYGAYWGHNGPDAYWCDYFVDWCFCMAYGRDTAKKLLGGFNGYTPTSAQNFKNMGRWHTSKPQTGDVTFFKNSERINHTGLIHNVSGSTVYTIEGNTSGSAGVTANGGGVFKKSYTIGNSRISGYGRPAYDSMEGGTDNTVSHVLKRGSTGQAVKELQEKLNVLSYGLSVDGIFGATTENAVRQFQSNNGLTADGQAGTATTAKLDAKAAAGKGEHSMAQWIESNGRWWYRHADGGYTRNDWELIGGIWYHFDNEGWMQTGWLLDKGSWYYLKESGAMAGNGTLTLHSKAHGNELFMFAANGHMMTTNDRGALV